MRLIWLGKTDDGGFGSAYAVKQFNPDRGQKLVKKAHQLKT